VKLKKDGESFQSSGVGDGPVDAVLAAIDAITGMKGRLQDYALRAATSGTDALGEVAMKVDFDGTIVSGKGSSTDVIEASARAYLSALNRAVHPSSQRVKEAGGV
jgi:2-isopropylmalate synthase